MEMSLAFCFLKLLSIKHINIAWKRTKCESLKNNDMSDQNIPQTGSFFTFKIITRMINDHNLFAVVATDKQILPNQIYTY